MMAETTLTEKEMLCAKIGVLSGVVALDAASPEEATDKLKKICQQHGFTFEQALELEKEIDQMLGDSVKV